MADGLARAARFLTRRYLLALGSIAALIIAAQAAIQWQLGRQGHDAAVVNLAGRQRMLSQELAKCALAAQLADGDERARWLAEARAVATEWRHAQQRLAHADDEPAMGARNSRAVASALSELEPIQARMLASAGALPAREAVEALLSEEPGFLRRMDAVVAQYEREAAGRVRVASALELSLAALALATIVGEALLVFRPAVRWLGRAIADRERLREQETINRELVAADQAAREIGYDLHDGVGQTLTALSLQAKAAARALGDHPAASELVGVRERAGEALAQVRAAARVLAPVDLRVANLGQALHELADATATATGVSCRAVCAAEVVAPDGEDLYRIAQEAVANALRHGQARAIAITLGREGREGVLAVADDGHGGSHPATEGVGMRSMRHRAERLGGRLGAGPAPGGGWRVECRFPLREA
jgi:signal transduction histidine kinase